jgi:hypothetical protein
MRGVGVMSSEMATPTQAQVGGRLRTLRLDRAELALLGAFALISVWVLGLDLWQVVANGRVWTGTDGSYITDQLQYLAWIQSASRHLLVANLFVLHGTPADYFQPAVAISGLLVAIGLSPWLALLVWKPVAVIGLFFAVRAFARRALPEAGRGPWLVVIALTLFYGSFTVVYGSFGVLGDLFPGFMSWGYPFALMAVAALIFALISYDTARRAGRVAWGPGMLGALAGILHPWQGELLVVVLVCVELFSSETRAALTGGLSARRLWAELSSPRIRLATVSIGGTLLPLLYYVALDKLDLSWALGRTASKHGTLALTILLVLLPLALVALTGYRGPPRNFLMRTARIWPWATIIIFLQSSSSAGATPLHAIFGLTLPLSVLAVDGCLRMGWRRLRFGRAAAVILILLFTVPTTYYELKDAKVNASPIRNNANFITRDERQALTFLRRDPVDGGVLTRVYLGLAVPALTGRRTFVGDCIWSEPGCPARQRLSNRLLSGAMSPARAKQFVVSTRARFVLADCATRGDLDRRLGSLVQSAYRFGCAAVYEVR